MRDARFRFRKSDRIGAASAEEDADFLRTCYVNTGELDQLKDIEDHNILVQGRTGSGKSALLRKLADDVPRQVISISPEDLALTYVTNSTILNFFTQIGVNLDPFFKLLWRHVITVEILARCLESEGGDTKGLVGRLVAMFTTEAKRDKQMRAAIDYLQKWGQKFWLETEYRVKEITETLESKLDAETKAAIGIPGSTLASSVNAAQSLSREQKSELQTRAQRVVSETQVQDLHRVMELLAKVLEERHCSYYLIIDRLDENWVEERIRYKLIMALIATAKEFIQVPNAKVILALRRDLIDRVFRLARDSGFQEEKYRSLYLPLTWPAKALLEILDRRVDALVASRYTKQKVTYRDLLPGEFEKRGIDTVISEIATTPRDVIAFFNECIAAAVDQSRLTAGALSRAVGNYSRQRLLALADEWSANFPGLLEFTKVLHRRPRSFKLESVTDGEVEELCLSICAAEPGEVGVLHQNAMRVVDSVMKADEFRGFLVQVFYRIGLVGLKLAPHEETSWIDESGRSVSIAEISRETSIVVHAKYSRALGVGS
ncbi:MAG: hypothetical protein ABSF35_19500 [Polyangia bacterium]|jgi:hypothetical protein